MKTCRGKDMEQRRKLLCIILMVLLVISLIANGILLAKLMNQPENPSLSLYDPEYAIGKTEATTVPEETTEPAQEQIISNKYITLICPADLSDRISVLSTEQDDGVSIVFSAVLDGREVELFAIDLTKAEPEGYILGQFQDGNDDQFHAVMRMNEINAEEWSEEAYNEICELQERVNDFIIQFYEDERFVPSR